MVLLGSLEHERTYFLWTPDLDKSGLRKKPRRLEVVLLLLLLTATAVLQSNNSSCSSDTKDRG